MASQVRISEPQANDIYLSVTMRMFSTQTNRNNCAVTEAFIDSIVADKEKYVCIPLCADTRKLKSGDHGHLGHMLDRHTGTFLTEQIGAFSRFEKVSDEYGVSLIGEARIAKRNARVCEAILELNDAGNLNFSFEILAQSTATEGGVTVIDAAEGNELIGMAVVSIPAYPEATALALVAEIEADNRQQAMLAHTDYEISEVDFETIRCWFFEVLRATLGEELWDYRVERVCVDCAILYNVRHGLTMKIEYVAGDEGLFVTDAYEVTYQRIENNGGNEMNDTQNKDFEAQAAVANAQAVEAKTLLTQAQATITTLETQVQDQDDRITELQDENNALREQADAVPGLQAEAEKLRGQIAEVEAESKREQLRQFASAHRLDMENETVAKAIAELDTITLMAESAKVVSVQEKPVIAPHAFSAGLQTEQPYGGLLDNE